ncbi:MAG TPA: hypothetical protein VND64_24830 [Pirellulales bacterium]|nr:hypothetical protein [Pirellulales bacterium]
MSFKIRCPNGHKLRVDAKDGGKKGMCPRCHARFTLARAPREVSDTSILTVLGDHQPDKSAIISSPAKEMQIQPGKLKVCPKCKAQIPAAFHICPNCRVYLPHDANPRAT